MAVGGHVICPKQPKATQSNTGISRHSTKFHSVHTLHTAIASAHRVCLRRAPSRAHARPGRERTTERNQSKKQQSPPHVHAQRASLSYLHILMTFFCCMNFHASTQAPRERVPAGAQAPPGPTRPPTHHPSGTRVSIPHTAVPVCVPKRATYACFSRPHVRFNTALELTKAPTNVRPERCSRHSLVLFATPHAWTRPCGLWWCSAHDSGCKQVPQATGLTLPDAR